MKIKNSVFIVCLFLASLVLGSEFGVFFLMVAPAYAETDVTEKAHVKGYVTQGDERYELSSVVVYREGPMLVVLLTDKEIPAGKIKTFADKLLEGTGLKGVKIGFGAPGSKLSERGASPLYVQFLPGDGSIIYSTGGASPGYEFEPGIMSLEHVAGRLHGTIVYTPEQVDVTFSTQIE